MLAKLESIVDAILKLIGWVILASMALGIFLLVFVLCSMIYAGIDIFFLQSV